MSKITAWKCDRTGRIFEFEADYLRHLRKAAGDRAKQSRRAKRARTLISSLVDLRLTAVDFLRISTWVQSNAAEIDAVFGRSLRPSRAHPLEIRDLVLMVRKPTDASNSHSAPDGLPSNWGGRKEGVPRHHRGFVGSVAFGHRGRGSFSFPTDLISAVGIRTGTGNGGGGRWEGWENGEYEATLFCDDWPALAEAAGEPPLSAHERLELVRRWTRSLLLAAGAGGGDDEDPAA